MSKVLKNVPVVFIGLIFIVLLSSVIQAQGPNLPPPPDRGRSLPQLELDATATPRPNERRPNDVVIPSVYPNPYKKVIDETEGEIPLDQKSEIIVRKSGGDFIQIWMAPSQFKKAQNEDLHSILGLSSGDEVVSYLPPLNSMLRKLPQLLRRPLEEPIPVADPLPGGNGGNDLIGVDLRKDISSVTTGQYLNYRHYVYAAEGPNNPDNDFTTAWFGIDLNADVPSGFAQAGILTRQGKAQWFVFSYAPIQCLIGSSGWGGLGCKGNYGDLDISPGNSAWTRVEAVTYWGQNWWILRVYDVNYVAYDVAKIFNGSKQIYRATAVSEQGYLYTNPHLLMHFYHYHPEYWNYGAGSFTLWPGSSGGSNPDTNNNLFTVPASACPTWYGATLSIQNNPHLWRVKSGDTTCVEPSVW